MAARRGVIWIFRPRAWGRGQRNEARTREIFLTYPRVLAGTTDLDFHGCRIQDRGSPHEPSTTHHPIFVDRDRDAVVKWILLTGHSAVHVAGTYKWEGVEVDHYHKTHKLRSLVYGIQSLALLPHVISRFGPDRDDRKESMRGAASAHSMDVYRFLHFNDVDVELPTPMSSLRKYMFAQTKKSTCVPRV